jgi:hypothetical protein
MTPMVTHTWDLVQQREELLAHALQHDRLAAECRARAVALRAIIKRDIERQARRIIQRGGRGVDLARVLGCSKEQAFKAARMAGVRFREARP